MGIQAFFNRDAKKNERIIKLQQRIATLTLDAETQEQVLASKDLLISALKADKMRLEQEAERRAEAMEALTGEYGKLLAKKQLLEEEAKERFEAIKAMRLSLAELLPFLRNLKPGDFRSNRKNLYDALREHIATYDRQA